MGTASTIEATSLESLAADVGRRLAARDLKLATAESCTGGWVAKLITDVAGSSAWLERGFVTYSNEAKQEMLGVASAILDAHGAVSAPVVEAMADGAIAQSRADWSLAISGIAGPGGGSADKPVGLVWFAWQQRGQTAQSEAHVFPGDRDAVRRAACITAMQGLLDRF